MSLLLKAYLAFSQVSDPLWKMVHRRRLKRGKENAERLPEKYGQYTQKRPKGEVLWFHALSVGESLALLPLIEKALKERPSAHVILTTSTVTSIAALNKAGLPDRAIHLLLPIDTKAAVGRFLGHWAPDLAAFAELDFWPRLMIETKARGIPMLLINSRMPHHNFERRRKLGRMMRSVLRLFDEALVQDEASADRLESLGADRKTIVVAGALKSVARPLPAEGDTLSSLEKAVAGRPVWLAAATIAQEDAAMIEAHRLVMKSVPDALMILAPRHVADGDKAKRLAEQEFDHVASRSKGEAIEAETNVYIADTIGEMGLWYRIAPISFVGHSLDLTGAGLEGKNPFEAAALGSAIIHGPATSYFSESYKALSEAGATREISSAVELAETIVDLQSPQKRDAMLAGARSVITEKSAVLDVTWEAIAKRLP